MPEPIARLMAFRRERTGYAEKAQAILDKAEGRNLTVPEQRQFDDLMTKAHDVRQQEDRYIKDNRLESQVASMDGAYTPVHLRETDLLGRGYETQGNGPATDKRWSAMFGQDSRLDTGGFRDFADFVRALAGPGVDSRLKYYGDSGDNVVFVNRESRTHVESVPSQGGFLVPVEYVSMLMDNSLEGEIIRPRATVWPMKSATLKVPAWQGEDHSSGEYYGGFQGVWLDEEGASTRQTSKMRQMTLVAKKLGLYTDASREVDADGINFAEQIRSALIGAIGQSLDYAFLHGTGAGQPLGVLESPSLITVSKASGQAADTIVYDNLVHMWARLHPACVRNALWLVSPETLPELLTLTVPVGTGGTVIPVMTGGSGSYSILSRPVVVTEKLSRLGDEGDVVLVDLSKYVIGLRQQVTLDSTNLVQWLTDKIDYRAILRVDGQAMWDKPITPRNGGDSLSWCVTLEDRT